MSRQNHNLLPKQTDQNETDQFRTYMLIMHKHTTYT